MIDGELDAVVGLAVRRCADLDVHDLDRAHPHAAADDEVRRGEPVCQRPELGDQDHPELVAVVLVDLEVVEPVEVGRPQRRATRAVVVADARAGAHVSPRSKTRVRSSRVRRMR